MLHMLRGIRPVASVKIQSDNAYDVLFCLHKYEQSCLRFLKDFEGVSVQCHLLLDCFIEQQRMHSVSEADIIHGVAGSIYLGAWQHLAGSTAGKQTLSCISVMMIPLLVTQRLWLLHDVTDGLDGCTCGVVSSRRYGATSER